MNVFANLKTAYKLALAFGLCIGLLIVTGGFGYFAISNANNTANSIASHRIPALTACLEIPEAVRTIQRDLRDALLLQDEAGVARWSASYAAANKKLLAQISAYESLAATPEEHAHADAMKSGNAATETFRNHVIELAIAKHYDDARKVMNSPEYKQVRALLETAATEALAYQRTTTGLAIKTNAEQGKRALNSIIGLSILGIVVGILAGLFITRFITRSLVQISERMEKLRAICLTGLCSGVSAMAEGDLTVSVTPTTPRSDIQTREEFGQMATTFNGMLAQTVQTLNAYNQARQSLSDLIGTVAESAESVAATSEQLSSSAAQADSASQSIAHSIHNVSNAAEQSASASHEMAQGSEQQAKSASDAANEMERLHTMIAQVKAGGHTAAGSGRAGERGDAPDRAGRRGGGAFRPADGDFRAAGDECGRNGQQSGGTDGSQHDPHPGSGPGFGTEGDGTRRDGAGDRSDCGNH